MEQSVYQQFYKIEKDHWWFIGMREICRGLLDQVGARAQITTGKCLDVGCGTGLWTKELFLDDRAVGLDFSEDAIAFCRERGLKCLVRASGESLPFARSSYNLITTLGVIEHLNDDQSFLKELFRVCKPGGYILILTSAFNSLWSRHDDIVHHKRRYTKKELERLIHESGLETVRASYVNTLLCVPIVVFRLIQRLSGMSEKFEDVEGSPDLFLPPRPINSLLERVLRLEGKLLRLFDLPFGVGIVVLARKPETEVG